MTALNPRHNVQIISKSCKSFHIQGYKFDHNLDTQEAHAPSQLDECTS